MSPAKQARRKQADASAAVSARKAPSSRLQGQNLRRALEELRDTRSERHAQELKRAIADSICGA
jgi:hypothetical protein